MKTEAYTHTLEKIGVKPSKPNQINSLLTYGKLFTIIRVSSTERDLVKYNLQL